MGVKQVWNIYQSNIEHSLGIQTCNMQNILQWEFGRGNQPKSLRYHSTHVVFQGPPLPSALIMSSSHTLLGPILILGSLLTSLNWLITINFSCRPKLTIAVRPPLLNVQCSGWREINLSIKRRLERKWRACHLHSVWQKTCHDSQR